MGLVIGVSLRFRFVFTSQILPQFTHDLRASPNSVSQNIEPYAIVLGELL